MKAMIFAAGLGTRLQQFTAHCPKALVEVNHTPLLYLVLDKLRLSGFDDIVINVHHFPDQIIDSVHAYPYVSKMHLQISDEREELLNTGGGLKKAFPLFLQDNDKDPILIHNVDILSNANLHALYDSLQNNDAQLLVSERQTSRYFLFNEEMRLIGWTNIQTGEIRSPYASLDITKCKRLAFTGIHVVGRSIYPAMNEWTDNFGITDFYIKECIHLKIRGFIQPDLHILDVGKPDTILQASQFIKEFC